MASEMRRNRPFWGKCRRGFNLVEVIIAAGIMMFILAGVIATGIASTTQWAVNKTKTSADNDASLALQRLTEEVRTGIKAAVSSDSKTLTITMPAVNSAGDYDRYTNGASWSFYQSNGSLFRKIGTGTAVQLGKNITGATFALGSGSAQVVATITSRQTQGTRYGETSYVTTISLRNDPAGVY